MKRTSILSKLSAFFTAAVVMCSGIISASAATVPTATIDTSKTASLTLYKYDFTTANEDGVLDTSTYVSTGFADKAVEKALAKYAIQGVEFTYAKIADIETHTDNKEENGAVIHETRVLYRMEKGDKTTAILSALGLTEKNRYKADSDSLYFTSDILLSALSTKLNVNETTTKNAMEAFVKNHGGKTMTETSDTGYSAVSGLPLGLYLFVETRLPEDVTDTTSPFLVSLPMTTIDGNEWNYDVTVYPKNETGMPTLEKTLRESKIDTGKHKGSNDISDGYAHTATGSDGDIVDYQIISTLPTITSNATALTTYTFVDTLSKGIEYNRNDVKIEWFKDKACTDLVTSWSESDNKFSVEYGTSKNKATTMTVTMTKSGLTEINTAATVYDLTLEQIRRGYSDLTMRITYSATVNSSADTVYGDNGNPNEVVLTWKRTNTEYYDTLKDDCHFYAYAIDLLKQFSDGNGNFKNVQFKVYNNTDGYFVVAELNEAEGVYYVTDQTEKETTDGTTFIPVNSGHIIIKGLEDDEYIITEVATDDKYTLLKEDISIVIAHKSNSNICSVCEKPSLTATATVNGDPVTMSEDSSSFNATVPLTVVNTPGYKLPDTGENSAYLMTLIGGCIFCASGAAIVFFIANRKMTTDNDI